MKFHHIGIACKDMHKTVTQFIAHHSNITAISNRLYDKAQDATLQIVTLDCGTKYEFVSGNMVSAFTKKNIDIYHMCFEVDSIEIEKQRLIEKGAFPISKTKPAILFGGRKVIFFKTLYGIIELLEKHPCAH